MIEKHSILYRTHQAWKYYAYLTCVLVASVLGGLSFLYQYTQWQQSALGIGGGGVIAFMGFCAAFSIKCPKCRARWYWNGLKKAITSTEVDSFRSQRNCPNCGNINE